MQNLAEFFKRHMPCKECANMRDEVRRLQCHKACLNDSYNEKTTELANLKKSFQSKLNVLIKLALQKHGEKGDERLLSIIAKCQQYKAELYDQKNK